MTLVEQLRKHLEELNVEKFHVSWNEEWLDKLNNMPEGPDRTDEVYKGLTNIMSALEQLKRGEYIDSPFDDSFLVEVDKNK